MVASKYLFLHISLPSLASVHLKDLLKQRFLLRLEQTEMELYKLNLVQALYDNTTTLLDCNLDSIVLIHNSAYHKFDTNSLFTDQRVHK